MNLRNLKGCLKDIPCFLIGNGPSANDVDLSLIKDHFTIGVNRAFLLIDPTILFWLDRAFIIAEEHRIQSLQAFKVCRDTTDPHKKYNHYSVDAASEFGFVERLDQLKGTGATGPLSFEFACALGCDPVVLVGFDCKHRNGQTDFYGINHHWHDRTIPNCIKGLKWISSVTSPQVINCSDNEIFTAKARFEDVVSGLARGLGREKLKGILDVYLK